MIEISSKLVNRPFKKMHILLEISLLTWKSQISIIFALPKVNPVGLSGLNFMRNLLPGLKAGAHQSITSAGQAFGKSLSSANKTAHTALDALFESAESTSKTINATCDYVTSTHQAVLASAGSVVQGGKQLISFALILSELGIMVSAIAAPVPIVIGLLLLDLAMHQAQTCSKSFTDERERVRHAKQQSRIVERLKKYGRIPQSAIIENSEIIMSINSVSGTIDGKIKTGLFKDRILTDLSDQQLQDIYLDFKLRESKDIVTAFRDWSKAHTA